MKYIVILGDGMADIPMPELGNKTPLQCANKPNMDSLAKRGEVGLVNTIPKGMPPGSDVANLSTMGFDPRLYYTGRSPLEAVSMGIKLADNDVTLRCNLVTLSDDEDYKHKILLDYSADEISSEEARILINEIGNRFNGPKISFYPGISYRHCMVWSNGPLDLDLTPPHDILEKPINQSFQRDTRLKRPTVAIPVLKRGRTMLIKIRKCPAPSIRAASKRVSGMVVLIKVRKMIV